MVRVEGVRALPEILVPVQCVGVDEDRLAGADVAVVDLVIVEHVARQHPHRRVEPHRLVEHLLDIGHGGEVAARCGTLAQHAACLFAGALLCGGIVGQQVERPGDRQRRGLVAGDDEELHVVQQVLRRHGAPGLRILGAQHVVEQVVERARSLPAPVVDRRRDHPVHGLDRAAPEELAGAGHPDWHLEEVQQRCAAHGEEILGDRLAVEIGVEMLAPRERHVADHVEGGREHLLDQLGLTTAGGEPASGAGGGFCHHRGQRLDIAGGKDRRDGAALPAPLRALGGEQRIVHRRAQHPQHDLGFRVVANVVEKDPLHPLGALHHVPARRACGAGDDGLGVGDAGNDAQHVAPRLAHAGEHAERLCGRGDGGRNEDGHGILTVGWPSAGDATPGLPSTYGGGAVGPALSGAVAASAPNCPP